MQPQTIAASEESSDEADFLLAYCLSSGLLLASLDSPGKHLHAVAVRHVPIACEPTPFPSESFKKALSYAPMFSQLVYRLLTSDKEVLLNTIRRVAEHDAFTQSLSKCINFGNRFEFGILRSDYMLDAPSSSLKQVELNTIACSLFGLAHKVTRLHQMRHANVPDNNCLEVVCNAFRKAHQLYKEAYQAEAIILMIIQDGERNVFDQSSIVIALHPIRAIRRTFSDLKYSISPDGALQVDGMEVSVIYWRSAYMPDDYVDEKCWETRKALEHSRAIKCPTVLMQLVGMKKMQEVLYRHPEIVPSELLDCFARFYDPADIDGIKDYSRLVLKPQREGGGNNTYGASIAHKLDELRAHADAFVLMELIDAKRRSTRLLKQGLIYANVETISELGTYGTLLSIDGKIVTNEYAGYVLRTKPSEASEGGLVHGISVLDAPHLF